MTKKDILIMLTLFFIFAVAWIGFSIYHSAVNSTISKDTNQDISPITPNFDIKIIDKLKQRQRISPSFEIESTISTPSPVVPTEAVSSQSGTEEKIIQ